MSPELDPRFEAQEAMRQALAASDALDRAKWLRIALAWQALAQDRESRLDIYSDQTVG